MAYDEDLAFRVRDLLSAERGVTEKRMFGGLAFLVDAKMAVAVSREGGLMLRVDPSQKDRLLARAGAGPCLMRGREMDGWMRVDGEGLRTRRQLDAWITRAVEYARSLPAARGRSAPARGRSAPARPAGRAS